MHVHIITVGASIIINFKNQTKDPNIRSLIENDKELLKRATPANPLFQTVYQLLQKNPYNMSAELNAMKEYLEKGEVDEAYLYYTSTGTGKFCATILQTYLKNIGINTHPIEVKGFGIEFEEGLVNLLDAITEKIIELKRRPNTQIYLNATGGFKPENAMLTIAASILGVENIYYMHEKFKKVESLPTIPLTITPKYLKILKTIKEQERKQGFALKREIPEANELISRNLIEESNGRIKLRKWTKIILKTTETT